MTAQTKDGKEVFYGSKIYMPQSPASGRGDRMVYGPFRKSGMLRDTSLQPGRTVVENFDIVFPYEDVEREGKKVRTVTAKQMDVTVRLWYLPGGGDPRTATAGKEKYLFHESTRAVSVQ